METNCLLSIHASNCPQNFSLIFQENPELPDRLRTMEIDYAQGFDVGKPLESIELPENDPLP
ncbi:MAG: hypothetical protein ACYC3O_05695 [Burkholderiales bacterium]